MTSSFLNDSDRYFTLRVRVWPAGSPREGSCEGKNVDAGRWGISLSWFSPSKIWCLGVCAFHESAVSWLSQDLGLTLLKVYSSILKSEPFTGLNCSRGGSTLKGQIFLALHSWKNWELNVWESVHLQLHSAWHLPLLITQAHTFHRTNRQDRKTDRNVSNLLPVNTDKWYLNVCIAVHLSHNPQPTKCDREKLLIDRQVTEHKLILTAF